MENYITEYMELPKRVYLPKDTEINEELILKLIKKHKENIVRYTALQGYYEGKAKIFERTKDYYKSNNKLKLDYASYIVDIFLGMFLGNPVSYTVAEDYKDQMAMVQEIYDLNDEQDENTELAKMASIKGRGYEIVYLDEDGAICFNEVRPENMVYILDDSIRPEPLFAIYFVEKEVEGEKYTDVTVYSKDYITEYRQKGNDLTLIDKRPNSFKDVPVVEFLNNDEGIGDFERVIPLIDAINLAQSDTANDFEDFTNAILILYGMVHADEEDVQKMMDDGVIVLDEVGGKQGAQWLIKEINDVATENYKNRLDRDIHKFAKVPNMSDENFAGNVSGESMKYKLFATDQVIASKQRKFKSALQRRNKLILSVLGITKGLNDFTYRDISIIFNDNKPYNELDNINTVKTALDAGLSKTYALGKLRDIDDIQEEIDRQAMERDPYQDAFNIEAYDEGQ